MEVSDGLGDREAESRTIVGAAGIQAAEALARLLSSVSRDARAAIPNLHSNLPFARFHLNPDV